MLALIACGPVPPNCVTSCGMLATVENCEALEAAQARVLRSFEHYIEWAPVEMCTALEALQLEIKPGDSVEFEDPWGRGRVGGLTYVETGPIVVASENWSKNGLCHELMHWFQWEIDQRVDFGVDPETGTHPGWRGVVDLAINKAMEPDR